jgi:hypothetical protein
MQRIIFGIVPAYGDNAGNVQIVSESRYKRAIRNWAKVVAPIDNQTALDLAKPSVQAGVKARHSNPATSLRTGYCLASSTRPDGTVLNLCVQNPPESATMQSREANSKVQKRFCKKIAKKRLKVSGVAASPVSHFEAKASKPVKPKQQPDKEEVSLVPRLIQLGKFKLCKCKGFCNCPNTMQTIGRKERTQIACERRK